MRIGSFQSHHASGSGVPLTLHELNATRGRSPQSPSAKTFCIDTASRTIFAYITEQLTKGFASGLVWDGSVRKMGDMRQSCPPQGDNFTTMTGRPKILSKIPTLNVKFEYRARIAFRGRPCERLGGVRVQRSTTYTATCQSQSQSCGPWGQGYQRCQLVRRISQQSTPLLLR